MGEKQLLALVNKLVKNLKTPVGISASLSDC